VAAGWCCISDLSAHGSRGGTAEDTSREFAETDTGQRTPAAFRFFEPILLHLLEKTPWCAGGLEPQTRLRF